MGECGLIARKARTDAYWGLVGDVGLGLFLVYVCVWAVVLNVGVLVLLGNQGNASFLGRL